MVRLTAPMSLWVGDAPDDGGDAPDDGGDAPDGGLGGGATPPMGSNYPLGGDAGDAGDAPRSFYSLSPIKREREGESRKERSREKEKKETKLSYLIYLDLRVALRTC